MKPSHLLQTQAAPTPSSDPGGLKELTAPTMTRQSPSNAPSSASCLPTRSDLDRPYLRGEHGGTGPDAPADHRLGEAALLDAAADLILLSAPYLPRNREQEKARELEAPILSCSKGTAAGKSFPNQTEARV